MIDVVTATDWRYARGAAVAFRSALDFASEPDNLRFNILDVGLSASQRRALESSLAPAVVRFFIIPAELLAKFPSPTGHISQATWARMFIADLMTDSSVAVYLDPDVVVRDDIVSLRYTDLQGRPVGAVQSAGEPYLSSFGAVSNWKELGLQPLEPYLHAGVLVLDLDWFRKTEFSGRAMKVAFDNKDTLELWDQQVMNIMLAAKGDSVRLWKRLAPRWNVIDVPRSERGEPVTGRPALENPERNLNISRDPAELIEEASIVHCVGKLKWWHSEFKGPKLRELALSVENGLTIGGETIRPGTAWKGAPFVSYNAGLERVGLAGAQQTNETAFS